MNTLKEYTACCRRIAKDLEHYVRGDMCNCDCGHVATWEEFRQNAKETEYYCPGCRGDLEEDDLLPLELDDYLKDTYGVDFLIDDNQNYRSAIVTIATNPTIYINTQVQEVQLFWNGYVVTSPLTTIALYPLEEYFKNLYRYTK